MAADEEIEVVPTEPPKKKGRTRARQHPPVVEDLLEEEGRVGVACSETAGQSSLSTFSSYFNGKKDGPRSVCSGTEEKSEEGASVDVDKEKDSQSIPQCFTDSIKDHGSEQEASVEKDINEERNSTDSRSSSSLFALARYFYRKIGSPRSSSGAEQAQDLGGGEKEEGEGGEGDEHYLSENTFSFLKVKPILSLGWLFAMGVYLMQLLLAAMILQQQIDLTAEGTPFDIPFKVDGTTRVAQVMALIFIVFMSKDVVMPIKEISLLWVTNEKEWSKVVGLVAQNDANVGVSVLRPRWLVWFARIFVPNVLQLVQGALMLIISFIIVVQTDDVVDLFADFAAMYIISDLDEIAFELAKNGYFGNDLTKDAHYVENLKLEDKVVNLCYIIPLRPLILLAVFLITLGSFIPVASNQVNGKYFRKKFPNCAIDAADIVKIGNGHCDGGLFNSFECGFDGGDCALFNVAFPSCKVQNPEEIGDGICQEQYKTDECGFDSLDCCEGDKSLISNGICDPLYNTAICSWDGGDCLVRNHNFCRVNQTELVGNGVCDGMPYNTAACGWDGGDCEIPNRNFITSYPNCIVFDSTFVNNSRCDGGDYMVESCDFDGGDCEEFLEKYPNCTVSEPWRVGDGQCDFGDYMVYECGWDGGDCIDEVYPNCEASDNHKAYFGNGVCDLLNDTMFGNGEVDDDIENFWYVVANQECGYEGGDCDEFFSPVASPSQSFVPSSFVPSIAPRL